MKYSVKSKNKVLDTILDSQWDASTYQVYNIAAFIESCSFIAFDELLFYLHILTFEHLIDADIENNQINSIYIFPDAFSRHAVSERDIRKFWIPLAISNLLGLLTLIATIFD